MTCRSCGAPLLWCITVKERRMPLDPEPLDPAVDYGTGIFTVEEVEGVKRCYAVTADTPADAPRYRSHFATCPNAAKHRRRSS